MEGTCLKKWDRTSLHGEGGWKPTSEKHRIGQFSNSWWKTPPKVVEKNRAKVLWDFKFQSDILANQPDIMVVEKKQKTAAVIDMANPVDNIRVLCPEECSPRDCSDTIAPIALRWFQGSVSWLFIVNDGFQVFQAFSGTFIAFPHREISPQWKPLQIVSAVHRACTFHFLIFF